MENEKQLQLKIVKCSINVEKTKILTELIDKIQEEYELFLYT